MLSPLVEGYLRNGDLGLTAATTLLASANPDLYVTALGHIGRAVENYLKAYIEFLGGEAGHSHNLGQLVRVIRSYPDNQLGKIGSSPALQELAPFITGSMYAFTTNLPHLEAREVERLLRFAHDVRTVIAQAVRV